jgi:AcrR family transcriptional regulator
VTELSIDAETGLRARKKRRTRDAIVEAAMDLFTRRGFDAVTVAEIARAADVSEKTVFNHFASKEDLVFEHRRERLAALADALRERPSGTPIITVFRSNTEAYLDRVQHGPADEVTAVPRLVMSSRSLRERLFLNWEKEAQVLAPIIADQTGAPPGDLLPLIVARTLTWTHRVIVREGFERLLAGEDGAQIAADLRDQAARAYDVLETGLAGYGERHGQ